MLSIFLCAYWPCVYLLRKSINSSPLPILNWGFVNCCHLYILDINLLSDIRLQMLSHSVGYSFTLFMVFSNVQMFIILMRSSLSVFLFVSHAFVLIFIKTLLNPWSWRFSSMFSSRNFIISALKFRSLIHFS